MTEPASYAIPLDKLELSARVPYDDQVLQEDVAVESPADDGVGHLPGGIRPYGV